MTTLVTGATGFVGSAVARALIAEGHPIRALTRLSSDQSNLEGLDIEVVTGDLQDRPSLERAVAGCDTVFHVAADYRLWTRRPQDLYDNNVTGTRHLMLAAADAGVQHIVYTSSVATLGLDADGSPANEQTPVSIDTMIGHYKRSKFLAEQEVKRLIDEQSLPAVIVNPSTPIGPRDLKPTPTGRVIVQAAAGKIPAFVDTGLNVVHVDDVARGHLLALEHGVIGERYILGGEDMTLESILVEIAKITGHRPPTVRIPRQLVLPVAYLAQGWAWLTHGQEPLTTVDGLRMSKKRMFFSSAKAKQQLGYTTRPAREALADAVAWFKTHGYC